MNFPEHLSKKLAHRKSEDAFRSLSLTGEGIDFSSNDYLGLSKTEDLYERAHQRLIGSGIQKSGAGGSRLLTGNHALYQQAESLLTTVHDCEAALIYPSGYMANVGLLGAIANRECVILYDSLSHASIREAVGFSNAKAYKFAHNDLDHLEQLICKYKDSSTEIFVVTESVFSMDGDSPDLPELAALCKKYNCYGILDEAHAVGVYGKQGAGLAVASNLAHSFFARVVTFGKALGCHGAAVLGSKQLIEYLINFSRPFIYTTGLAPIAVATIVEGYLWMQNSEQFIQRQKKLYRNIALLRLHLKNNGLTEYFIDSNSPIQCCIVSENSKAKALAAALQHKELDVRPILAPTVPKGQERLRICIHSFNTEAQINTLVQLLSQTLDVVK